MLRIHNRRIHIRENLKFVRHAYVVAIRRNSISDHTFAHLPVGERLDHLVLQRHFADPPVWLNRHPCLLTSPLNFELFSYVTALDVSRTVSSRTPPIQLHFL